MEKGPTTTTDIIVILYGDGHVLHVMDNNKENIGFTRACNNGMKQGKAPYI